MTNSRRTPTWKFLLATALLAPAAAGPAAAQDAIRISVVEPVTTGEWADEIKAGAMAAAASLDYPVEVRVVGPSTFSPSDMIRIFQTETLTAPDVIVVTNVVADLMIEPGLTAKENGVRLAWINSAPTEDFADDLFVSADPLDMGRSVAKVIADASSARLGIPAAEIEGNVVVGLCVAGLVLLEDRIKGTVAGLADLMPRVGISPMVETKSPRDQSYSVWNQVVRRDPGALAYQDACEPGSVNLAKIIEDDGLDAITVGYDAPEEIRQAVARGAAPAALSSNFFTQAYFAVLLSAQAVHDGTAAPAGWLPVPPVYLDSANIEAYIDAWEDPEVRLLEFNADAIAGVNATVEAGDFRSAAEFNTQSQ